MFNFFNFRRVRDGEYNTSETRSNEPSHGGDLEYSGNEDGKDIDEDEDLEEEDIEEEEEEEDIEEDEDIDEDEERCSDRSNFTADSPSFFAFFKKIK